MSFYKAAPLIAVLLGTAALNACSTMPDTANPAEWYRSTVDFFAGEQGGNDRFDLSAEQAR